MKGIALAAVMAAWFAVQVNGLQSKPCLNGCKEGQKPPDCCQEPSCQIYQDLVLYSQGVRAMSGTGWDKSISLISAGSDQLYDNAFGQELANWSEEINQIVPCSEHKTPSRFQVSRDCSIVTAKGVPVNSPGEARSASPDCQEVADAEYNAAYLLQASCQDDLAKGRKIVTASEATDRMELAYFIAETTLQKSFEQFWASCVPFWGKDKSQEILDTYGNALRTQMPSKPPIQISPRVMQAGRKKLP